MQSASDSSSDMEAVAASPAPVASRKAPVVPGAPKPVVRTASRSVLVSRASVEQPTFDDTDDELGIAKKESPPAPPAKKARVAKREARAGVVRRLFATSEGALRAKVDELLSIDLEVAIVPMNYAIAHQPLQDGAHYVDCHTYRNNSPAENFDVDESSPDEAAGRLKRKGKNDSIVSDCEPEVFLPMSAFGKEGPLPPDTWPRKDVWEPGAAELAGIAVHAYEIADYLLASKRNAVIVVSKKGGNAPKLLAGCVAQAVRKLATRDEAIAIVGHRAPYPTGELVRIYDAFPKWTRITAPHEIVSFA